MWGWSFQGALPGAAQPRPRLLWLPPKGRGWAVVRVADRRFLRVQKEPEGRQRIRGETDMLPDSPEGVGGRQGLEPGLCAFLPARDAEAAVTPVVG